MKCNCCGCQITGDIKKNKYVYYSCTNGKGICRKELDQVQNRISRLVDSHLDGKIDGDIYEQKLNEYKKRQQEIISLMANHVDADKASLITVKTVLDLAKRAKELYESSKVDEKRQILNFLFSNLEMRDKKAIITLREPFDRLVAVSDHPMYRRRWDSNPRNVFTFTRFPSGLHRPLEHSSRKEHPTILPKGIIKIQA